MYRFLFTIRVGIQGYTMYIDQNGDSEANYTVVALRDDSTVDFGESLKPVGHFSSDGLNIPVRLLCSIT